MARNNTKTAINELNDNGSTYLKIGNTVYTLNKVATNGLDIEKEIIEYNKNKLDRIVRELSEGVVAEINAERDKQLQHIANYNRRRDTSVTIPSSLLGKPVMYYRNQVLEARIVNYSPEYILGTKDYFTSYLSEKSITKLSIKGNSLYYIKINSPFSVPLVLVHDTRGRHIYTPFQKTYHTLSDKVLCTGNASAETWWRMNDTELESNINCINICSLATHDIKIDYDKEVRLETIFNDGTVISASKRGDDTWKID